MTDPAMPWYDLRRTGAVAAGTQRWDGPDVVTGWHRHPLHQVEYAFEGVAEVETADGHYLLPPRQAMWIPAGVAHNTTLRGVRSVSVFFEPAMLAIPAARARVLAVAPVIREMIRYATRWPIERDEPGGDALAFFHALVGVIADSLGDEVPYHLPTSTDPLVVEIMRSTREQLVTATAASVCRAVGVSERTMRRRFAESCELSWQEYLAQARLLRAMTLLVATVRPVVDVGDEVGFGSLSGFARAFRALTGESPAAYRRRVASGVAGAEPSGARSPLHTR
jgi:AraC-like DNA-binding protein